MNCVPASELLLRTRAREVLSYLRFLRIAVEKNATVTASASSGQLQHRMPRDLTYTLKANLYLLLYSAMEATFIQLIDDIHEVVGNNAVTVDSLHSDLLIQVVRSFKESPKQITSQEAQMPIGAAVMNRWCKEWQSKTKGKEKRTGTLSGNVDGLSMHQYLRSYGVVAGTDRPLPHLTHKALQYSKERRNILAHGELGFAELGRGYAVEELIADARGVFRTLARISQEVNSYLDAKGYLKDSSWHS